MGQEGFFTLGVHRDTDSAGGGNPKTGQAGGLP